MSENVSNFSSLLPLPKYQPYESALVHYVKRASHAYLNWNMTLILVGVRDQA